MGEILSLDASFVQRYCAALRSYCDHPGEPGLQAAYELGREASGALNVGMIDLLDLHHTALEDLVCRTDEDCTVRLLMLRAAAFLTEVMPHFEMKLRGFQEANQRLRQRTHELGRAQEKAMLASQAKSRFLSQMSHELRTPLNSIIGFTEVMASGMAGAVTAEQVKQLGLVTDAALHLLSLVNDLLDLGRIEAGRLVPYVETFNLDELLENVLRSVQPLAERKGLELVRELGAKGLVMQSDRRLLRQILLNLMHNAIKFTKRGSVTLQSGQRDERLELAVVDTGPGIESSELKRLFRPFEQLHPESDLAGSGLGLYLSQTFAEQLGGTIEVESEVGQGSRFVVKLPLEIPRAD